MKKILLHTLMALMAVSVLSACDMTEDGYKPIDDSFFRLDVSSSTLNFEAVSGSTAEIEITATVDWQIDYSSSHFKFSKLSGTGNDKVTITAEGNYTQNQVVSSFTINAVGLPVESQPLKSKTVSLAQRAIMLEFLKDYNADSKFDAMGGSLDVVIKSSIEYMPIVLYDIEPSSDWISIKDQSNDKYSIVANFNPSIYPRTANCFFVPIDDDIFFNYTHGINLEIYQNGRNLSVLSESLIRVPSYAGKTDVFKIIADGDYEISKQGAESWFDVIEVNGGFLLDYKDNTGATKREGKIIVSLSGLPAGESCKYEITLTQTNSPFDIGGEGYESEENWDL